jgi:hypothetical protein
MGPGIVIKALLQGSFSLMVFGWAQIIMDIQPLIVLITGQGHLHGFTHTYIGATLLAVVSGLSGKYLSELGLIIIGISKKTNPVKITWWITFVSAFIGTYSHVVLDSIAHVDLEPFSPFNLNNDLYGLLTFDQVHEFCFYSGVVGVLLYYSVQFVTKRRIE